MFLHVGIDEHDALARIPRELLVPAPGRPDLLVVGYDENGHCPMFVDGACSIYSDRPRTCRHYDCRVFAAAGVEPHQPAIAPRVREWQFTTDDDSAAALRAVSAAAAFVATRAAELGDVAPRGATRIALAAIRLRHLFGDGEPKVDAVRVELTPRRVSST